VGVNEAMALTVDQLLAAETSSDEESPPAVAVPAASEVRVLLLWMLAAPLVPGGRVVRQQQIQEKGGAQELTATSTLPPRTNCWGVFPGVPCPTPPIPDEACSEEVIKNNQDVLKSMPTATTEDRCAQFDATIEFLRRFDGCEIQGRKIDAAAEEANLQAAKTSLQCGQAPAVTPTPAPTPALWPQWGEGKRRCSGGDTTKPVTQNDCQGAAVAAGVNHYSWRSSKGGKCRVSPTCDSITDGNTDWAIFKQFAEEGCIEEAIKKKQDALKSMITAQQDQCAIVDAQIAFVKEFDDCEIGGRKVDGAAEAATLEATKQTELQCGQAPAPPSPTGEWTPPAGTDCAGVFPGASCSE